MNKQKTEKELIEEIRAELSDMKWYKNYNEIAKKDRHKILDNQFLIKDEKGNLIISGGGRVLLFLILSKGSMKKELDEAIKQRNKEKIKQNFIFQRALRFYGYKINYKINPCEVLK